MSRGIKTVPGGRVYSPDNGALFATFPAHGSFTRPRSQLGEQGRQIGPNADGGRRTLFDVASVDDHHRQCVVAVIKKAYQVVLMDPVDLSQQPFDSISPDSRPDAPGREPDLDGPLRVSQFLARDDPVNDPDTSARQHADVRSSAIEQGSDQAPAFEAERPRQALKRHLFSRPLTRSARHRPAQPGDAGYLPVRLSLTESVLRPFLRRRFSILRPLLDFIRDRKPCLLARLRLLGWYVRFIIL